MAVLQPVSSKNLNTIILRSQIYVEIILFCVIFMMAIAQQSKWKLNIKIVFFLYEQILLCYRANAMQCNSIPRKCNVCTHRFACSTFHRKSSAIFVGSTPTTLICKYFINQLDINAPSSKWIKSDVVVTKFNWNCNKYR